MGFFVRRVKNVSRHATCSIQIYYLCSMMTHSMFHGITTVFFDIDDTLWWFTRNSRVALRLTHDNLLRGKLNCDYDTFHSLYLKENDRLWDLYHHGHIDKEYLVSERFRCVIGALGYQGDCDAMSEKLNEDYLTRLALQPIVVPGAPQLLERLSARGLELNALSNGFKGVQQLKLESGGIARYIKHVVLSDDCGITKPMRGIFDYALQVTGSRADEVVMIGDNPETDIRGAHDAGWHTIYFNIKNQPAIAGTADYEVASLDEIF